MSDWFDYEYAGFLVRSRVEFPGVERIVSGREPEVVVDWGAVPPVPNPRSLSETWSMLGTTLVIQVEGVARFAVTSERTVAVEAVPEASSKDMALYLMGPVLGAICHLRGVFPLHASAVRTGDSCVAFAGPSGAGKSTIAGFLTRQGFELVADDVCVVASSDPLAVWPGPPRLKLSTDGLEAMNEDWSGLAHAGGTRERYHLARERGERSRDPVPLSRLYVMETGPELRVEPVTGLDAVRAVTSQTYCLGFVDALKVSARHFKLSVRVAKQLEIRRLIRPFGFEHMDRILDLLEADWRKAAAAGSNDPGGSNA